MSSSRKSATVCNNSGNAMSPLARPGVRSSVAIVDMCLIGFMGSSNLALNLTPCMNSSRPERGLLKSANIESQEDSLAFTGDLFNQEVRARRKQQGSYGYHRTTFTTGKKTMEKIRSIVSPPAFHAK